MMGRDSPVKTAKERGPPPLPKLGKGMAPLAIPIDVRMRSQAPAIPAQLHDSLCGCTTRPYTSPPWS